MRTTKHALRDWKCIGLFRIKAATVLTGLPALVLSAMSYTVTTRDSVADGLVATTSNYPK